ncbi:MAG: bifunctional [glutamate--ammonia ligase]-adenylyl-L-tyrosine phosphorylase/[glutamate--ammonia-ligase] adenylyltransferase [Pseudomonadota bacterium]
MNDDTSSSKLKNVWQSVSYQNLRRVHASLSTEAAAQLSEVDQERASRVLAASNFVTRICCQQTGLFEEMMGGLTPDVENYTVGVANCLEKQSDDPALTAALRKLRNREMAVIAWNDLSGAMDVESVLKATSKLADAIIDQSVHYLYESMRAQWGTPMNSEGEAQQIVVLGMGKLGGSELNFSSDVDFIFAYPERGETRLDEGTNRKSLDNATFFTRLAQALIRWLNDVTPDGFVYRVDMRLRPFGDAGALVSSFDALEEYYQSHGREWERYALIKARVVAGDKIRGDSLLRALRPFVYRRYLDYGAIESLRELKSKIALEVARKGMRDNIKLGPGGIREIEFIGQVFQLIRGGQNTELQSRSILRTITALSQQGLIASKEADTLSDAYRFLRRLENRLQMRNDEQVHTLPGESDELAILCASMGYDNVDDFSSTLESHRATVNSLFESVFRIEPNPADEAGPMSAVWDRIDGSDATASAFEMTGFVQAQEAFERLAAFKASRAVTNLSARARARLDALMPLALECVADTHNPDDTLQRLLNLLRAIVGRSVYIAVLRDAPAMLERLVGLLSASVWAADFVTRHPLVIDELLNPDEEALKRERAAYEDEARALITRLPDDDLGERMDAMRRFKQSCLLHIVSADLDGSLPVMKVSDQLTWLAEALLQVISDQIWDELVAKHGRPTCVVDGDAVKPGFGIVAYGKLGGIELGYGSDLDIVFLHESEGGAQMTDGVSPIDNAAFFARMAQKLVHFISTLTPAGILYEVDTRLRPNGASGLLVSSIDAFADYQREQAWTWEHQAMVRGQMIVGSVRLRRRFEQLRADILCQAREKFDLAKEVTDMRSRMQRELSKGDSVVFDLKQDRGGVADIEFMVQYLVLGWSQDVPELTQYTDNIRILETAGRTGVLPVPQTEQLAHAYLKLREVLHRRVLQGDSAVLPHEQLDNAALENVRAIWQSLLPADESAVST